MIWAQKPSDLVEAMLIEAGFSLSTWSLRTEEGRARVGSGSVCCDGELGARAGSESVPSTPSCQDLLMHILTPR